MDPSSSSSAPPPPRASFGSLPLELVKQVVAEEKVDTRIHAGVDVVWSYWYGRGISALSFVDKRLRSLALPHLVESINTKQASALCTFPGLSTSPIASMVRRVNFENDWLDFGQIAVAVLHLKAVTELKLSYFNVCDIVDDGHGLDAAEQAQRILLRHAFATLAPRLEVLEVSLIGYDATVALLDLVTCPSVLRVLRVSYDGTPFSDNLVKLRSALANLTLEELDIADTIEFFEDEVAPDTIHVSWIGGLSMPTLKSFSFEANYPLPERFLEFVESAFPNLTSLGLTLSDLTMAQPPLEGTRGLSPLLLPHLQRLALADTVATHPSFVHRALQCLAASPLSTLVIQSHPAAPSQLLSTLDSLFPPSLTLPATLARLHFPSYSLIGHWDRDETARLAAFATRRGVSVMIPRPTRRSVRLNAAADARRAGYAGLNAVNELQASARGLLRWALDRVDTTGRVGDVVGLAEMNAVCAPLMGRRNIEEA
ncbi:hypothetical protein JCM10450v2_004995 [Rhodotorula kratochvilovae]